MIFKPLLIIARPLAIIKKMNEPLDINFLPKKIETKLTWQNLLINKRGYCQIKELEGWLNDSNSLLDNIEFKSKKSRLVLFYGPPGTGKTLTATLLGKYTNRDVYRIDLSFVVSKYIGETEKNLEKVFKKGENKNWILFFDEADALFGKRKEVQDAHDRHANQVGSYLLQLINNHSGLVILSTTLIENVDKESIRRFETIIEFKRLTFIKRMILRLKTFIFSEKQNQN